MKTAIKVMRVLQDAGYEAYMVGGAVRDYIIGKDPHDIDVATSAAPHLVKDLFARTVDTGIQHGTVLVLIESYGIEVTTFRTDGIYSDNRRPESVEFVKSLTEDLRRRDFTINAMAMTEEMQVIDPFGGQEDLKKHLIRAVGDPDQRFKEDALRMLRAIRFTSQLDFTICPKTLASIKRHAGLIRFVAIERIKIEIDKILFNEHTERSMDYMVTTGLLNYLPAGNLFSVDWGSYDPIGNSTSGWVYMLYKTDSNFKSIAGYKFSNEEKRLIKGALKAVRLEIWDEWTYYSYTVGQLQIAADILGLDVDILEKKQDLPIHSLAEIKIKGNDLIQWSGHKQGPWIKHCLEQLEKEIVYGRLKNNREIIKDWFLHEYQGDK